MILAWRDRLAAATAIASSQVANLPVQNALVDPVGLPWVIPANSGYADFDLGATTSLRVFAALGTNLTAAATTRIQLGATQGDASIYDSGTIAAGATAAFPQVYKLLDQAYSARWVRWTFTDASLSELRLGRLFAAPAWETTRNFAYGARLRWVDPSLRDKSKGGQTLVRVRPRYRVVEFSLPALPEAEAMAHAFALDQEAGLASNVLAMLDPVGWRQEKSVYGLMQDVSPHELVSFGLVRTTYQIEERL